MGTGRRMLFYGDSPQDWASRIPDQSMGLELANNNIQDWQLRGEKMISMFHEIRRTVETTAARSSLHISRILNILGISRAWCYRHLDLPPIIDKRFNPFEINDEELRVLKYRYQHKKMSFRLLAYSMIDKDIA